MRRPTERVVRLAADAAVAGITGSTVSSDGRSPSFSRHRDSIGLRSTCGAFSVRLAFTVLVLRRARSGRFVPARTRSVKATAGTARPVSSRPKSFNEPLTGGFASCGVRVTPTVGLGTLTSLGFSGALADPYGGSRSAVS